MITRSAIRIENVHVQGIVLSIGYRGGSTITPLLTAPVWNEMRGKNRSQEDGDPKISIITDKNSLENVA